MIKRAYGKVNLSIDVICRNEQGYHDLDMIELPIDLYDEIEMEIADQPFYCCNADLPFDEKNLIWKAIELLRAEYGFKEQFAIRVTKRIPMNAGLAGGSSNAAATIRLVNELLKLQMSEEKMITLGKKLGADVPFCLINKPARVRGIGEIIEPFILEKGYGILLIKPQQGVSTREAYETLQIDKAEHPDIVRIREALIRHEPLDELLGNSLQQSAFRLVPEIKKIIKQCRKLGYGNAIMSGSGSTCFVLFELDQDVHELEEKMQKQYPFVCKTAILTE